MTEDRHQRNRALENRLHRAILVDPDSIQRYRTDTATHLQVQILRDLLLVADKAMEAEGIGHSTRDRIAHWIIFGEAPPGFDTDPDVEAERAAVKRVNRERLAKTLALSPAIDRAEWEGGTT